MGSPHVNGSAWMKLFVPAASTQTARARTDTASAATSPWQEQAQQPRDARGCVPSIGSTTHVGSFYTPKPRFISSRKSPKRLDKQGDINGP